MRIIIDRFEGDIAVVELDNEMLSVPRGLFPGAREGDAVEITVLGKVRRTGEDPRELFEQLREQSKLKKRQKKNAEKS